MKCSNLSCQDSLEICLFCNNVRIHPGFLHCGLFILGCDTEIVSQIKFTRYIVEWLIVHVDVEQQWGQSTALKQAILLVLYLLHLGF